mgnify:FL=1
MLTKALNTELPQYPRYDGTEKLNLLGLAPGELRYFFKGLGEKPYRAHQVMHWVYRRGVLDFHGMTDLSVQFRKRLDLIATLDLPEIAHTDRSKDGTTKWLVNVGSGQAVETVFIPELSRGTLCISSQAGCALDCAFCATGYHGFNRNLTAAEILGQVFLANRGLKIEGAITNIVFMGMGEPLANYRNVMPVVQLLVDDYGFGLSRRRVTISTAGLVPMIYRLAKECNVALAVSLHAPTDDLRDQLVPINKRHPIRQLLKACWHYAEEIASRQITFEYVMLRDVNDSLEQARQLTGLVRGRPAKVNLIPFNSFPGAQFQCSSKHAIDEFCQYLRSRGVVTTIRQTRGNDIDAACGQLAGKVENRMRVRLRDKVLKRLS